MNKLNSLYYNIETMLHTLFLRRNKNVVLVGAWMGEKFADNSRYLYQYLFHNKKELGLSDVIWATRNSKVNDMLNKMGYTSCLIGTKESKYWHLKAGTHIICNMAFDQAKYLADIDTKYSCGAKKIQLWHGVGVKSVGASSNNARRNPHKSSFFHGSKFATLLSQGCWNESYVLCTSEYNVGVNQSYMNRTDGHFFISCYPRNCGCIQYLESEKEVLNKITKYHTVLMYLPTFRSNYDDYTHPLTDSCFLEYLKSNGILWIEKPHSASDFDYSEIDCVDNVLLLDPEFDVNVLYDHITCLVSDYSSAVLDSIYRNIPTIMYIPDVEVFKNGDVGFLFDIEEYFDGIITKDINSLIQIIEEVKDGAFFDDKRISVFSKASKQFFGNIKSSYHDLWDSILRLR